jgi:NitT/TauT family transport system permease protein
MRIGLGVAWMCIMAAEMIGGEMLGLGRLILKYAELLRVDVILASMLTIGIIGLLMNEAFIRVENYVLRWRVEVRI